QFHALQKMVLPGEAYFAPLVLHCFAAPAPSHVRVRTERGRQNNVEELGREVTRERWTAVLKRRTRGTLLRVTTSTQGASACPPAYCTMASAFAATIMSPRAM